VFLRVANDLEKMSQSRGPSGAMDGPLLPLDEIEILVLRHQLSPHADQLEAHLGGRIRHRRWMLGITQQQLAGLTGLTVEQVQRLETGGGPVNASRMRLMSVAMEVPAAYFFDGVGVESAEQAQVQDEAKTQS